ncbi:MAG: GNAT family N-acetyltransferase [Micrococcus sp.]|nr:GNAT family N-acetyltransferase [Micrococcus sp.]
MSGAGKQPRYYVRDAAQADLEAVLAMKAAAWREAYGHLRDEAFFAAAEATLPQQVEHWRRELERGTELWLAEDAHGRCVGLASAGPAREASPRPSGGAPRAANAGTGAPVDPAGPGLPSLELHALYVLAEAQGTGVADALMARAVGPAPCRLWVLAVNDRARAFYRRHGFVDVDAPQPMSGPWEGLDAQLMVRRGA